MRRTDRGSITVYLCFCLAISAACTGVFLESARIRGIVSRTDRTAHSALESVMADYNRTIMEEYDLFVLDYGKKTKNGQEAQARWRTYFDKESDETAGSFIYEILFDAELFSIQESYCSITSVWTLLDEEGQIFANQAAQYMKYREVGNLVSRLMEQIKIMLKGKEGRDALWQEGTKSSAEGAESTAWGDDFGISLSMVLPEGREVSDEKISAAGLPSQSQDISSQEPGQSPVWNEVSEEILIGEYLLEHFPGFVDRAEQEKITCQLEYILFGKLSDRGNMARMADLLLAVRSGLNLIALLSSERMQTAAEAAAAAISTVLLNPELTPLIQIVLECIWAYREAVRDVAVLLEGEKIIFLKKDSQWVESLVPFGQSAETEESAGEIGAAAQQTGEAMSVIEGLKNIGNQAEEIRSVEMSYQDYIRMFLLLLSPKVKYYRAMDMIQVHMQINYPDFQVSDCICGMEASVVAKGKPKFFLFTSQFFFPWEIRKQYEITRKVSFLY